MNLARFFRFLVQQADLSIKKGPLLVSYLYHFKIHLGGYICFLSALDDASCKRIPEIISKLAEIRSEVTNITETVYKVKIAFAQLASRYLFFAAGEKS